MQRITSKKNWQMGLVLVCAAATEQAFAHTQNGSLTLASGVSATDYYQVTCSSETDGTATANLFFQIRDLTAGGNLVGMSVVKADAPANKAAYTTIDPVGGPANTVYSPGITMPGGNGVYNVLVWRTGVAANESYSFEYHCQNADGSVHTPTSIVRISNQ